MGFKMKGYQAHGKSPLHSEGRWSRFKNWVSSNMPQTDQFPRGSSGMIADEKGAYEEAMERNARRKAKFDKNEKGRKESNNYGRGDYEPRDYETYIQDFGGGSDLRTIKRWEDIQAAKKTKGNQQGMISTDENAMLEE